MVKISVDLQDDPFIPEGRELIENLVAAHIAAADEEELLHLIGVSLSDIYASTAGDALRILTHATYHAQDLIVRLLELASERGVALRGSLPITDPSASHADRIRNERLELWSALRDGRP